MGYPGGPSQARATLCSGAAISRSARNIGANSNVRNAETKNAARGSADNIGTNRQLQGAWPMGGSPESGRERLAATEAPQGLWRGLLRGTKSSNPPWDPRTPRNAAPNPHIDMRESRPTVLMAAGCAKVFKEKVSGAKTDRPELAKAIRRLEDGDVLLVTRLDRLARSTRDLLNVLDEINKRGAGFKSLKDSWADTTTPHGRLMLTILGGLAEFDRELIRARTGEGRKRAKARGVKFGRPVKLTAHQRKEALQRLAEGAAQADVARSYGVSPPTISRLAAASPFE